MMAGLTGHVWTFDELFETVLKSATQSYDTTRWLLYTFWRTRSELDYARGRIEAYQKVEEWMNQP